MLAEFAIYEKKERDVASATASLRSTCFNRRGVGRLCGASAIHVPVYRIARDVIGVFLAKICGSCGRRAIQSATSCVSRVVPRRPAERCSTTQENAANMAVSRRVRRNAASHHGDARGIVAKSPTI